MQGKKIIWIIVFLVSFAFANAIPLVLMTDRGDGVRMKSTGMIMSKGNLTITLYDANISGTLIFNHTYVDSIRNGSWDVSMQLPIEYGKSYWEDYAINGEDLDFEGNERMRFQSSSGYINNVSFFNLSMITYTDKNVNSSKYSNQTTWWAGLTGWLGKWFVNSGNNLKINETTLNTTIDTRVTSISYGKFYARNITTKKIKSIDNANVGMWMNSTDIILGNITGLI